MIERSTYSRVVLYVLVDCPIPNRPVHHAHEFSAVPCVSGCDGSNSMGASDLSARVSSSTSVLWSPVAIGVGGCDMPLTSVTPVVVVACGLLGPPQRPRLHQCLGSCNSPRESHSCSPLNGFTRLHYPATRPCPWRQLRYAIDVGRSDRRGGVSDFMGLLGPPQRSRRLQ